MATDVVIGLSAVVIAIKDGEAVALTVRPRDAWRQPSPLEGLPFGPFDPDGHRTFEIALREFVTRQTRFELGFVEQLYTFGDKGREAPLADVGAGAARVISVGYLALAPLAVETEAPDTAWSPFLDFFPWEDWRRGRPDDHRRGASLPALTGWAGRSETRLRPRAAAVRRSTARPGTRSGCSTATSCSTRRAWRRRRPATGPARWAASRPSRPRSASARR